MNHRSSNHNISWNTVDPGTVVLFDKILGTGSYSVVRTALWYGLKVAVKVVCKRKHELIEMVRELDVWWFVSFSS